MIEKIIEEIEISGDRLRACDGEKYVLISDRQNKNVWWEVDINRTIIELREKGSWLLPLIKDDKKIEIEKCTHDHVLFCLHYIKMDVFLYFSDEDRYIHIPSEIIPDSPSTRERLLYSVRNDMFQEIKKEHQRTFFGGQAGKPPQHNTFSQQHGLM